MIGQYCYYGNQTAIQEAQRRFKAHATTPIPSDMRSVVFSTVMRNGDADVFQELVKVGVVRRGCGLLLLTL